MPSPFFSLKKLLIVGASLIGVLVFSIIVIFAGDGEHEAVKPSGELFEELSDSGEDGIPKKVFDLAYQVNRKTGIPWTFLMALAEEATEYGRRSPYDSTLRRSSTPDETNSTSLFPIIEPPIGDNGDADPAVLGENRQALGPLLIWPEVAQEYPSRNPQDWRDAFEIVAYELRDLIDEAKNSGNPMPTPPRSASSDEVTVGLTEYDLWWVDIFSRLRAGRPPSESAPFICLFDEDDALAVAVSRAFRCAVASTSGAYTLAGYTPPHEGVVDMDAMDLELFSWNTGVDAREQVVRDAAAVVYLWAGGDQWEKPLKDISVPGCGSGTPVSGWSGAIPLNASMASLVGVANTCDHVEVLSAVSRYVAAKAAVHPEKRTQEDLLWDGWAWNSIVVPHPTDFQVRLDHLSATQALSQPHAASSLVCRSAWDRYFLGDSSNGESWAGAIAITRVLADGVEDPTDPTLIAAGLLDGTLDVDLSAIEEQLAAARKKAEIEQNCGYASLPSDQVPYLISEAENDQFQRFTEERRHAADDVESETPDSTLPDMADAHESVSDDEVGLLAWHLYRQQRTSLPQTHVLGTDPLVPRFMAPEVQRSIRLPAPPPPESSTFNSDFGNRIIQTAIKLGGTAPGDARGGNVGQVSMGVTLALVNDDSCGPFGDNECKKYYIGTLANARKQVQEGRLVPLGHFAQTERCSKLGGSGLDTYSLTAVPLAEAFGRMCDAAAADGVHLSGGGSRTYEQQVAVRKANCGANWASRKAKCNPATAYPGNSYHEYGLAIDTNARFGNEAYYWMHAVVGCYKGDLYGPDPNATYRTLPQPVSPEEYVKNPPCQDGETPVKRANTFGVVFAVRCSAEYGLNNPTVMKCPGGQFEPWHIQLGIPLGVTVSATSSLPGELPTLKAASKEECYTEARKLPTGPGPNGRKFDSQLIANAVFAIFECVLRHEGYDQLPPSEVSWEANGTTYRWSGKERGFANLAHQIASEAVVVGYCESHFADSALLNNNHTGKYGGVFQMGDGEMKAGGPRMNKFDPIDNIYSAANLFLQRGKGNSWENYEGWQPWAVVNTKFWKTNPGVYVPALPRFKSHRPGYEGLPGPELPDWAVNVGKVPIQAGVGCPLDGKRTW